MGEIESRDIKIRILGTRKVNGISRPAVFLEKQNGPMGVAETIVWSELKSWMKDLKWDIQES